MKNYKFPPQIITALELLEKEGFEAVVVGGAVRDFFLDKEPHDFDLATNATVEEMSKVFKDFKVIETGIKHGTLTIHIDHFPTEITSYRGQTNTLKEDLYLRDFTFNSMAMDKNYNLYDFYNGKQDLESKTVRCNSEHTFINDPLRILRAIRQSVKYHFSIDATTKKLMERDSKLLSKVSNERISSELSQILVSDNPQKSIKENIDIFLEIIPELKDMIGFEQNNPHHIYDVFDHTMKVLENTPPNLEIRLAALFHDIGKPKCYSEDEEGIGHFYGHDEISSKMAREILKRLKFDNKTIDNVCKLIEFHDYPIYDNEKSLKKFLNKFDDNDLIDSLFILKGADILGQNLKHKNNMQELKSANKTIKKIIKEKESCFTLKQLNVNGKDLIGIGIKDGKLIGQCLNQLLSDVIEGTVANEKEALLEHIKKKSLNRR